MENDPNEPNQAKALDAYLDTLNLIDHADLNADFRQQLTESIDRLVQLFFASLEKEVGRE